ncbi:DUF6702 family protein [Lutibacter sp. B1]|uniref:DUF6702 family protein n=1 Tax=Lutibacter sp. B1 TaxID=2725996 RepID=UPI0014571A26|nr:DUF6702 family protein [Lutibacter sp. B1]NLP57984.1 hypothetical protein [Lutibacter sp. B1]
MKLKKLYFFLLLSIPLFAFTMHKYYVSLCEIEYVEDQKSIQIILGLFIDDLEFTLNKDAKKNLYLASTEEVQNIDAYYKEYLNNHFKVVVNNKAQNFNFIGKEYDGDIVRFYLEITDIKELKSLQITNTSLFRDFENQQNIIKIKVNKFNKTFYLDKNNPKGLLNF